MIGALLLGCLGLLPPAVAAGAESVALAIVNEGQAPLRCQLLLAHWMSESLAPLAPGAETRLTLGRDAAGQLFLERAGEARPFHLEALVCGADLGTARRHLDLSALRRGEAAGLVARCDPADEPPCRTEAHP